MCADTARPADETPDYRNTVFLPETDFPMRAGLPQREPDWLARWERIGVYDRLREKAAGTRALHAARRPALCQRPPPYRPRAEQGAEGHGGAVAADDGPDARYVPGWDCHGLPIEWKIEEQYRAKGLNKDDVDVVAFRQECRRFAEGWVDVQREEFKRLGVTGNWADPYLTMDYHAEAVIAAEFMTFLMNGSLYQGSKPVMWSPVEKTALAEAEVEYHDHTSHQVWVRVQGRLRRRTTGVGDAASEAVDRGTRRQRLKDARVLIWTTTPWTIPQNRAVAFNPEIAYGLYEVTGRPQDSQRDHRRDAIWSPTSWPNRCSRRRSSTRRCIGGFVP